MTRFVGPTEQGQLQGARSSINGIAEIAGRPLCFVFATSSSKRPPSAPRSPFLLAAAILLLCAGLAAYVTRPSAMAPCGQPEQRGAVRRVTSGAGCA